MLIFGFFDSFGSKVKTIKKNSLGATRVCRRLVRDRARVRVRIRIRIRVTYIISPSIGVPEIKFFQRMSHFGA